MTLSHHEVNIRITTTLFDLPGTLNVPQDPVGIVLFAHGSGSSRLSPRNLQVARILNRAGIATLLFDLLTPGESRDRDNVFDIQLLANRLLLATSWIREQDPLRALQIGYFGASTGAAAALQAAATPGSEIAAVVSRGGRPDLAERELPNVISPTLLIVGERDEPVLSWNRHALTLLKGGRLEIIPNATHLFEEPGALEAVAELAKHWFLTCFADPVPGAKENNILSAS